MRRQMPSSDGVRTVTVITREVIPGKHPVFPMQEWEQHSVYSVMLGHSSEGDRFYRDVYPMKSIEPTLIYNPDMSDSTTDKGVAWKYAWNVLGYRSFLMLELNYKFMSNRLYQLKSGHANENSDLKHLLTHMENSYEARGEEVDYLVIPFSKVVISPRTVLRHRRPWDEESETVESHVCDIFFYDDNENVVAEVRTGSNDWNEIPQVKKVYSGRGERWTSKTKTILFSEQQKQNALPMVKDYGCAGCGNAEYVVREGGVFLKCTKYEGEVLETQYDGTYYPDYCMCADAKKIRKIMTEGKA